MNLKQKENINYLLKQDLHHKDGETRNNKIICLNSNLYHKDIRFSYVYILRF
jgi:hypothetical protein